MEQVAVLRFTGRHSLFVSKETGFLEMLTLDETKRTMYMQLFDVYVLDVTKNLSSFFL